MTQYTWRWEEEGVALVFTIDENGLFQDEFIRIKLPFSDEASVQTTVNGLNAIGRMCDELMRVKLEEGVPPSKLLDFNGIIDSISEALADKSGDEVRDIHNQICDTQVEYLGDNL